MFGVDNFPRGIISTRNLCKFSYQMAGILLDTQNLSPSLKLSMTRDAEAVQLLSVASAPNYRNTLFDQCMFSISRRYLATSRESSGTIN